LSLSLFFSVSFFCGAGGRTPCLSHARQVLNLWVTPALSLLS
jgi:hypothetical protein